MPARLRPDHPHSTQEDRSSALTALVLPADEPKPLRQAGNRARILDNSGRQLAPALQPSRNLQGTPRQATAWLTRVFWFGF